MVMKIVRGLRSAVQNYDHKSEAKKDARYIKNSYFLHSSRRRKASVREESQGVGIFVQERY